APGSCASCAAPPCPNAAWVSAAACSADTAKAEWRRKCAPGSALPLGRFSNMLKQPTMALSALLDGVLEHNNADYRAHTQGYHYAPVTSHHCSVRRHAACR